METEEKRLVTDGALTINQGFNFILTGIEITTDDLSIKLKTNKGDVIGVCDAECCSSTWIETIELPALGFPCQVINAEELRMPDAVEDEDGHDYLQFYGLKLVTTSGEIIIEYRNSSNGYYGGDLVWNAESYYGGVFSQQDPNSEWLNVDKWLANKSSASINKIEDETK